jgi:hypothetical protein
MLNTADSRKKTKEESEAFMTCTTRETWESNDGKQWLSRRGRDSIHGVVGRWTNWGDVESKGSKHGQGSE